MNIGLLLYGLQTLEHHWAAEVFSLLSFSWAASAEINKKYLQAGA
jgi:hypothetical protein